MVASMAESEAEIALDAIAAYLSNLTQIDSLLGLFADDPEWLPRALELKDASLAIPFAVHQAV